jgi:hypothetical protein
MDKEAKAEDRVTTDKNRTNVSSTYVMFCYWRTKDWIRILA